MLKKCRNGLIIILLAFFSMINVSYAKEMTVTEIEKEVEKDHNTTPYFYIIGEYVFTGDMLIDTRDIMLAARTISATDADGYTKSDAIYGKMSIHQVDRSFSGIRPTGWKIVNNYVGDTQINDNTKFNIKYIDYKFVKEDSKFSLNFDKVKEENYKSVLDTTYNYKTDNDLGDLKLENGEFTGIVKLKNDINSFAEGAKTGYYLPFVILVPDAKEGTTIKIEGKEISTATYQNFDKTDSEKGIVVLWAIDPENTNKKITITVDIDGESEKDIYAPMTKTIDWSKVVFQEKSEATISDNIPKADSDSIAKNWGYVLPTGEHKNYTFEEKKGEVNTFELKGKIEPQHTNNGVFATNGEEGYYFLFNIQKPKDMDKIPDGALIEAEGKNKQTFKGSDLDQNGLSILFKLDETCKSQSNGDKCKITIKVDWDGEDNDKYLPVTYTIAYKDLTFEKASTFTIDEIDDSSDPFETSYGWNEKEGYKTDFTKIGDNPHKLEVSGLLPIFEDEDWTNDPFSSSYAPYYLGFIIKLDNGIDVADNKDKITVKFFHDDEEEGEEKVKISKDDFDDSKTLYVLKYLKYTNVDGTPIADSEKVFDVTVDLDGDGDEYAPYTITVDWSKLLLQEYSKGMDFDIINSDKGLNDIDKKDFSNFGYDYKADDLEVKNNVDEEGNQGSKYITGVVREQELKEATGYSELEGYYIPVKIEFPKDLNEKYHDSLTIKLYSKDGSSREVKPTSEDFKQGYLLVLCQVNRGQSEIKYEIDYDGKGNDFIPLTNKIELKEIDYRAKNEVTFNYLDENGDPKTTEEPIIVYEDEKIDQDLIPKIDYTVPYHTFDYWTETGDEFDFDAEVFGQDDDRTLNAYWTLDTDKFISDVVSDLDGEKTSYSEDFNSNFDITKVDNKITIDVKDATFLLKNMDNTSIPGAIAYVLNKDEVKDITLTFGGNKVILTKDGQNNEIQTASLASELETLKGKIKTGAYELFKKELSDNVDTITLNKMALSDNNNFSITIGETASNVKLKSEDQKAYTFEFKTDIAEVENETELSQALSKGVKKIHITKGFTVNDKLTIAQTVSITGGDNITLTGSGSLDSIFDVTAKNVNISKLKLTGAKKAIKVSESGTVTFTELDVSGNEEVGIDVAENGTISGDKLTMTDETYDKPAIRKSKSDASSVKLTDNKNAVASKITKEKITKWEDNGKDTSNYSDSKSLDETYDYYNYYNNSDNSKIYKVTFKVNESFARTTTFIRLVKAGDKVIAPPEEKDNVALKYFTEFNRDGIIYKLLGYSVNNIASVDKINSENINKEYVCKGTSDTEGKTVVEEALCKDNLSIITSDKMLYTVYEKSLKEGAIEVKSASELKDALSKNYTEIYIPANVTIDYTTEDEGILTISKKLTLAGRDQDSSILKVKKISVNAESVYLNKLVINGEQTSNTESLIDVNAAKFSLWSSSITNTSEIENALKISSTSNIEANIKYNKFGAENNKIKTFINLDGPIAGTINFDGQTYNTTGTDLYLNRFIRATESGNFTKDTNSDIKIKKFAEGNQNVRISSSTFSNNCYAIRLSSEFANQNSAIRLLYSNNANIAVDVTSDKNDFKGVSIKSNLSSGIKTYYIKDSEVTEDNNPEGQDKNIDVLYNQKIEGES